MWLPALVQRPRDRGRVPIHQARRRGRDGVRWQRGLRPRASAGGFREDERALYEVLYCTLPSLSVSRRTSLLSVWRQNYHLSTLFVVPGFTCFCLV